MSFSERKRPASPIYKTKRWSQLRERKLVSVDYCCQRCGQLTEPSKLQVHHVTPLHLGGAKFPPLDKLEALCLSCHGRETLHEMHDRRRTDADADSRHGINVRDADGWGMSYDERQAKGRR